MYFMHANTHTRCCFSCLLFCTPAMPRGVLPLELVFTVEAGCWKFALLRNLANTLEFLLHEKLPSTTCPESGKTWVDISKDAELGWRWRASLASTELSLLPRWTML